MNFLFFLLLLILIFCILGLFYCHFFNKFQYFIIKINEAESNIDSNLRKKFDLINRSINMINSYIEIEKSTFKNIVKIRSRKLSNFDLDRELIDAMGIIYNLNEKNSELNESESFKSLLSNILEIDQNINATKSYYNDNITHYNRLIKSIPSNIVAKFNNFIEKPFFDGKNLEDNDINDFKI